jgi:hypothetical protein
VPCVLWPLPCARGARQSRGFPLCCRHPTSVVEASIFARWCCQ